MKLSEQFIAVGCCTFDKYIPVPMYKMTRAEIKSIVFRYVFGYYNTIRITSMNPNGLPPTIYRQQTEAKAA